MTQECRLSSVLQSQASTASSHSPTDWDHWRHTGLVLPIWTTFKCYLRECLPIDGRAWTVFLFHGKPDFTPMEIANVWLGKAFICMWYSAVSHLEMNTVKCKSNNVSKRPVQNAYLPKLMIKFGLVVKKKKKKCVTTAAHHWKLLNIWATVCAG